MNISPLARETLQVFRHFAGEKMAMICHSFESIIDVEESSDGTRTAYALTGSRGGTQRRSISESNNRCSKEDQMDVVTPERIASSKHETDNGNSAVAPASQQLREETMNMKSERDRLRTYTDWPCAFMDPKELARAGFYYMHFEDAVRCAFCNIEIARWERGDNAMNDHQRWSNNCPFLRGLDVGNIPLDPNDVLELPRNSHDTCGRFGIEIRPNSVAECAQPQIELSKLGVTEIRGPVFPNCATQESRLRTFKEWPKSIKQKPEELAEAGFFYTGKGDQTLCFSCGGGLKDWLESDDPWEQHAKWFSKCTFVNMVKGRPFITEICNRFDALITAEQGSQIEVNEQSKVKESSSPSTTTESSPSTSLGSSPSTSAPISSKNTNNNNNNNNSNDSRLCKICYTEDLGVVFLPCGHIVACVKCAPSLSTCAICRQPFTATVRAFLS